MYPALEPHLYPVLSGPPAWYPAEAHVRPVWTGGGPAYIPPVAKKTQERPDIVISSIETWGEWDEEWYPTAPRSLAKLARAAGWEARIGFARGPVPGQAKDTWEMRDTIGVWVNGFGKRGMAMWERNPDAEFSARKLDAGTIKAGEIPSGMQWSTAGTSIRTGNGMSWNYANLTDFKEWLTLQGAVLPSWYTMVQAWVQAHEERDARKAKKAKPAERQHA
jgi:hypothetical protein